MKTQYIIVGGMAGSSMDGLDLVLALFERIGDHWEYNILKSETVSYSDVIYDKLKSSLKDSVKDQEKLDIHFGQWIGEQIKLFLIANQQPDLLAIHGHTLIHSPEKGISWQLGHGQVIADATGLPTVTEFRSADIMIGGQGAPLVPLGDFELFSEYDACLNLGGIANGSIRDARKAGDICPCNQVLNYYAQQMGHPYDRDGALAEKGYVNSSFLQKLEKIDFFHQTFPKSLPNAFFSPELLNQVDSLSGLRTYSEFIARQVEKALAPYEKVNSKLLVTGGGALNKYLVKLMTIKMERWEVVVPDDRLVAFKEAIVFAYLGLKRLLGQINVLGSVTGGRHDTSSGVIHLPK